jgi:tetratricopeptide (TPR) repeat protein
MERTKDGALGVVALTEGRLDDAIAAFRRFDDGNSCETCAAAWLARAYDRAGNVDSARVLYQRLLEAPSEEIWFDAGHLGYAYLRLGQLSQDRGERQRAADYYGRFLTLWDRADPEMQAWVRQARAALAAIAGDRPSGS